MSAQALTCRKCGEAVRTLSDGSHYCGTCRLSVDRPVPEGEVSLAGPVLVKLSDVEREEVTWLWEGRIPSGRLTCLAGDPDAGKSWLSLALATAVTTGAPFPGQQEGQEPANVLILQAEDALNDTVRPRAEDMGADLSRIVSLTAVRDEEGTERHVSLLRDIKQLDKALSAGGYKLVIIDPINAYLGGDLDTYRDSSLRSALAPLAIIAARWSVAVVFIMHLNQGRGLKAIYRPLGSIGYVGAARSALLVGINPDDESERVLVPFKGNLAPPSPAIAFEIEDGRFAWRGETSMTAAALLVDEEDGGGRDALAVAREFLKDVLVDGPVDVKTVRREGKDNGIADRTLDRAKAALGVRAERRGEQGRRGGGTWFWGLPDIKSAKNANTGDVAHISDSLSEPALDGEPLGALNQDADNGPKPTGGPLVRYAVEELGLRGRQGRGRSGDEAGGDDRRGQR